MPLQPTRPCWSAGIIERQDNHVLIALPKDGQPSSRVWRFPRGPVERDESPEAAMRRIAREQLGLHVEVVVGQPPLVERVEGREAELRYFFCGVAGEDADPGPYAEIRWVSKGHLREYEFDSPSKPVVEWLLGSLQ
jgi:ADP-ribose pyrophosphatase YjhB (NUDIX family)